MPIHYPVHQRRQIVTKLKPSTHYKKIQTQTPALPITLGACVGSRTADGLNRPHRSRNYDGSSGAHHGRSCLAAAQHQLPPWRASTLLTASEGAGAKR